MFRKAHDENRKQDELEKKRKQKEVEMEKARGTNKTKGPVKQLSILMVLLAIYGVEVNFSRYRPKAPPLVST